MGVILDCFLSLAPNSEKELSFDTDRFDKIIKQVEDNTKEVVNKKDEVLANIEQLKKDWKTPAGEYFFKNLDTDWVDAVEKYKKTMKTFSDVMNDVKDILSLVESEISTITF